MSLLFDNFSDSQIPWGLCDVRKSFRFVGSIAVFGLSEKFTYPIFAVCPGFCDTIDCSSSNMMVGLAN